VVRKRMCDANGDLIVTGWIDTIHCSHSCVSINMTGMDLLYNVTGGLGEGAQSDAYEMLDDDGGHGSDLIRYVTCHTQRPPYVPHTRQGHNHTKPKPKPEPIASLATSCATTIVTLRTLIVIITTLT
jgi:hypothetical protein